MKLRIKGNSLRLRVSRSETTRLMQTGRIEETILFGAEDDAKLTYALEHSGATTELSVRYRPLEVAVMLSTEEARRWSNSDQVGFYRDIAIRGEVLAVLVEKDFACLDGSDADNEDTFENPNIETAC
jgi:hypothetical protein